MSFELACRILTGAVSASSFVAVTLSLPSLAPITGPLAVTGGFFGAVGGYKYSEEMCDFGAKKVCHEVYEQFDGPKSNWPEYLASRTVGPPGHMATVKAQCIEEGRYYPTTPATPT